MKARLEIEFKEMPVEKIQQTLLEILHALKVVDIIEDGNFEILTPNGVVTEKCLIKESRIIA